MRCKWCGGALGDAQFCPSRALIPGERFPCEAEDPATPTESKYRRKLERSLFGNGRKSRR